MPVDISPVPKPSRLSKQLYIGGFLLKYQRPHTFCTAFHCAGASFPEPGTQTEAEVVVAGRGVWGLNVCYRRKGPETLRFEWRLGFRVFRVLGFKEKLTFRVATAQV